MDSASNVRVEPGTTLLTVPVTGNVGIFGESHIWSGNENPNHNCPASVEKKSGITVPHGFSVAVNSVVEPATGVMVRSAHCSITPVPASANRVGQLTFMVTFCAHVPVRSHVSPKVQSRL